MADEALLDLARADAVAGARDEVVDPADAAVVALLVDLGQVARVQPAVAHLRGRRRLVAPVAEEHDRVALDPHRDLTVDEPQLVPRIGTAHPARPLRPGGAVADQQVRLGLAVELVQPHAEPLAAPRRGLLADRLAPARDRPQRHRHAVAAPHHPQRRRGHEDVADAGVGDHVERELGVEPRRAEGDDRHAVGEARHDDVVEAADPRPVGRRPDPVARLREEVVRELEAGQVAGQHAMTVEGALRRAGRARRCRRAAPACRVSSPPP